MQEFIQWLVDKVEKVIAPNGILLDVGAYHGDFTKPLLATHRFKSAVLFEPNTKNMAELRHTFQDQANVRLVDSAVSHEVGQVDFYCTNDFATGSVLAYEDKQAAPSTIHKTTVNQTTLDLFVQNDLSNAAISFIKIDTQGHDLNVLKGAEAILQRDAPMVVVEFIFVNLYQQQASPHAISAWLAERNYSLAGVFNEHYTQEGWLAFADAVFVPNKLMSEFTEPYHARPEWQQLKNENDMLRATCEERLILINTLHEEASKRLEIIQQLKKDSWLNNIRKRVARFLKPSIS